MNASKTLLIVTPLLILVILWLSSGQDSQQGREHSVSTDVVASDLSEDESGSSMDVGSAEALEELQNAESNPQQLQELHRAQSVLLRQAWGEWHRSVKQTSDTVGAISLAQLKTFATIVERLPPEYQHTGDESLQETSFDDIETEAIIEQLARLNGLIKELAALEQDYREMSLAKTAMNAQRVSWVRQSKRHQFDFSAAQKLSLEKAKQVTMQHIEAEDFASATTGYKAMALIYQGDADAIQGIIAAREKALAAKQKWQTLAAQILGHKIDTKGVESNFFGARKFAQQGDYQASVKQYEYAEKGWIKSAAKGLVFKATPSFVTLPAGTFNMGDKSGGGQRDELPVQAKSVASFAMGATELTFDQYDAYLLATGATEFNADENWGRGSRPVININFSEAKDFAAWLSVQTNRNFALPTETQWEYAASFTTGGKNDFTNLTQKAHCEGCNGWGHTKTLAVAQFPANDAGLFDMFGNVWEWVSDCYQPTYSEPAPAQCDTRVARGGSWGDLPTDLRASNRSPVKFSERSNQLGFRLVENF